MDTPKPVGIWIRVSMEDQAKGKSLEHRGKRAKGYSPGKTAEGLIMREITRSLEDG